MAQQWFKFYGGEYLSDPKMLALNASERSCWLTLLCYASMSGKDGAVCHLNEDMLLAQSGITPLSDEFEKTKGLLEKLSKLMMITLDNGMITITNWRKRQEVALSGYERVKRYREKQSNDNDDNESDNTRVEENREEKNRIDKKEDKKEKFGEFQKVLLTLEECQKLNEKIGQKNTLLLIEELDNYIASKGKKYSNHYATILNWARRKYQEKNSKGKSIIT